MKTLNKVPLTHQNQLLKAKKVQTPNKYDTAAGQYGTSSGI